MKIASAQKQPHEQVHSTPAYSAETTNLTRTAALWLVLAMLLTGLLIRIVWLSRCSYQIDEILQIIEMLNLPHLSMLFGYELERFQIHHRMPLLPGIVYVASRLLAPPGQFPSEWITRLPLAIIGTATLPLFYLLGRAFRDRTAGLWAMFLATVSVFHIYHSREAYDYALVVFMTAGMLWSSLGLLQRWCADYTISPQHAVGYALFSSGMLYTHLSCLLFLPFWSVAMVWELCRHAGWRELLKGTRLPAWGGILGCAYLIYLPFIVKLLTSGWVRHETFEQPLKWSFIPAVLGAMGWGAGSLPLTFFSLAVVLGVLGSSASRGRHWNWILALQALVFAALQTRMAKIARFEVRYYSPLFPILILFAATGIAGCLNRVALQLRRPSRAWVLHAVVVALLLAWLAPSLWHVVRLSYRQPNNYKAVANWINANLPTNGVYAFTQTHFFRGVPVAYATPDRFPACPMPFDNEQQFQERKVAERAASFFRRFPRACLIEWERDYNYMPPALRALLFCRETMLSDPHFEALIRLKTVPIGIWYENSDRAFISYNLPEDLPRLAARRGERFYHSFGPEWEFFQDEYMNPWLTVTRRGTVEIGSLAAAPVSVALELKVASVPGLGTLTVSEKNGKTLGQFELPHRQVQSVVVTNVLLQPGTNSLILTFTAFPTARGGRLLLADIVLPRE